MSATLLERINMRRAREVMQQLRGQPSAGVWARIHEDELIAEVKRLEQALAAALAPDPDIQRCGKRT